MPAGPKPAPERITFLCNSQVLGGGELCVLRVAEALMHSREVKIVTANPSALAAAARETGVPVGSLAIGPKLRRRTGLVTLSKWPRAHRKLHGLVRDSTRGGWLVMQYKWEELLWGGRTAPQRVVLWEHGPIAASLLRLAPVRGRLRASFSRAAELFAWSDPAAHAIRELCAREPIPLQAGVDQQAAEAAVVNRRATRERLGLPADAIVAAYVGRVEEGKGILQAVGALATLPEAHLLICGVGRALPAVRRLSERLRLTDRIHMLGMVRTPLEYLAAADVSLLLTRMAEGRPLSALESLAVGTPVLGLASSPAMRALTREGEVVLLADARPETIRDAMRALAGKPRPGHRPPLWSWQDTGLAFVEAPERTRPTKP